MIGLQTYHNGWKKYVVRLKKIHHVLCNAMHPPQCVALPFITNSLAHRAGLLPYINTCIFVHLATMHNSEWALVVNQYFLDSGRNKKFKFVPPIVSTAATQEIPTLKTFFFFAFYVLVTINKIKYSLFLKDWIFPLKKCIGIRQFLYSRSIEFMDITGKGYTCTLYVQGHMPLIYYLYVLCLFTVALPGIGFTFHRAIACCTWGSARLYHILITVISKAPLYTWRHKHSWLTSRDVSASFVKPCN